MHTGSSICKHVYCLFLLNQFLFYVKLCWEQACVIVQCWWGPLHPIIDNQERVGPAETSSRAPLNMKLLSAIVVLLVRISEVRLDCGVNRTTQAGTASAVEGCICPEGYKVERGRANNPKQTILSPYIHILRDPILSSTRRP